MALTFITRWSSHHRHPCHVWTISDTVCKLRHVQPFFAFSYWENSRKMQNLSNTMEDLNYFRHHMQVATRLAIYRSFLTEKTLENAKLVKNPSNLDWCLELVMQGHEKIKAILRMSKNHVLSDGPFWPTWTPSVEHGVFTDIVEITLNFPLGGHAHGRHPWQVWTTSETICKMQHV